MATTAQGITCANFLFYNNFDSANLARVESVSASDTIERDGCNIGIGPSRITEQLFDYEFNVWTKHDCHGTEFQNDSRTWFYFGIKAPVPGACIKINVVNLNRQSKMFSQGMCPVFKVIPGHPHWERIRDKPTYTMDQKGNEFTISFTIRTPDNLKSILYVAFTYPFTYGDLQYYLNKIDARMSKQNVTSADAIYYHRECAINSLEGRRLEVLTISSHHNISTEREARLKGMFPECEVERPFKFRGKRVVFVSARVHPGETPSSFVFNGFLNFLLNNEDPIAIILRRIYVFKLIPMLNPDGVARGHYRMDTRGVNLNRVYLNPSITDHPTIFAARSLIRYYHYFYEEKEDNISELQKLSTDKNKCLEQLNSTCVNVKKDIELISSTDNENIEEIQDKSDEYSENVGKKNTLDISSNASKLSKSSEDSGLFLYIDLHGHATKKGIFMYGNYFDNSDDTIMCMLLPKLMSINNCNFHFTSCNFTEKNMYLIDKRDGMSREGSGRVAVYKMTGLVRSYTLECNYNSGRLVNTIPARVRDTLVKSQGQMFVPPKYTPTVFEEVGAALGPSILDLTNSNPNSRIPNSQYRSLRGVKSYLKLTYVNNVTSTINKPRLKGLSSHEIGPKDSSYFEDIVTTTINTLPSEESGSSQKQRDIPSKSRIVCHTSSLYSAVKRIKSGKRSARPLSANCKFVKNQRHLNNVENGPVSKIRSSRIGLKATVLKTTGLRYLVGDIYHHRHHQVNRMTSNRGKKTIVEFIGEQTSVLKKGTKRIKISESISKTKPEVGESSKQGGESFTRKKITLTGDKNVKYKLSR
ncbi:cytosolic carboxypeptidase-like protein 5 [Chelonus insularis]|uniref:cytosolic carboxypeptidase-like protein 5 n=1 Tax=Chelonus insularis TaxID=460826 RepID=UPI00158B36D3|nr:cytosolic carboxypeptidase-like protein 5 [Chelonus insularis]